MQLRTKEQRRSQDATAFEGHPMEAIYACYVPSQWYPFMLQNYFNQ